jgi:hypothetical protein
MPKMTVDQWLDVSGLKGRWSLKARILVFLLAAGETGCTADEVNAGLEEDKRHTGSVAMTIDRLVKVGLVEPCTTKRMTRKGWAATVFVIPEKSRALIEVPKAKK